MYEYMNKNEKVSRCFGSLHICVNFFSKGDIVTNDEGFISLYSFHKDLQVTKYLPDILNKLNAMTLLDAGLAHAGAYQVTSCG